MAAIDDTTFGRGRLSFADERDIDEFVDKLQQYERGGANNSGQDYVAGH